MKRPACIVFDVGGTTLRASVVTSQGRLVAPPLRMETPNIWNYPHEPLARVQTRLVDVLVATTRHLQQQYRHLALRHVGIAMAGPVTHDGVVRHVSGLWGHRGHQFPLLARLKRQLHLRYLIVNDMTAAAAYYGSLPPYRRARWIAVITVSSGVGSKVVDTHTREVLLDPAGISGELGHVRVDRSPTALRCECGVRGHVQGLCSGRAAERLARRLAQEQPRRFRASRLWRLTRGRPQRMTTYHLAEAVRRQDRFALDVLDRVTEPLARAIALLVGTIGIERVILVGGFALGVGQPYLRALQRHLVHIGCYGRSAAATRALVCLGQRNDAQGLLGVGRLVQQGA